MTSALALAEIAPLVSQLLSTAQESPGGAQKIAHHVVEMAKKITKEEAPSSAIRVLSQDPHMLLEYEKALENIEFELERTYLQDRLNARERDAALIAAGRSNTRADIMVVSAAAGLLFCLLALGYYHTELPGEAVGIISTIAGIFGSCLKDAYAFEFGSSRGSKTKDLVNLLGKRGGL